jgi:2-iminobutanoate/2-iminopropanoate deaminase
MKKIINTPKAPKPIGPYSQAVMTNSTLYVSGQIPINPSTGEWAKDNVAEQARQVMENIKEILKVAGMDFSNVIKCSIFISSMKNFPIINEVYGKYFTEDFPARETVEVAGLPLGVDVEISCIAVM